MFKFYWNSLRQWLLDWCQVSLLHLVAELAKMKSTGIHVAKLLHLSSCQVQRVSGEYHLEDGGDAAKGPDSAASAKSEQAAATTTFHNDLKKSFQEETSDPEATSDRTLPHVQSQSLEKGRRDAAVQTEVEEAPLANMELEMSPKFVPSTIRFVQISSCCIVLLDNKHPRYRIPYRSISLNITQRQALVCASHAPDWIWFAEKGNSRVCTGSLEGESLRKDQRMRQDGQYWLYYVTISLICFDWSYEFQLSNFVSGCFQFKGHLSLSRAMHDPLEYYCRGWVSTCQIATTATIAKLERCLWARMFDEVCVDFS